MVQHFANNEGINCPAIAQATILLLMYVDDVVLVSRTKENANKMMTVLEDFCELSGLWVNTDKTKAMLSKMKGKREKIQPRITYQGKPIEVVDSFKYLSLEIPSDHKWYKCTTKRREHGKRAYYAFENMCRQVDIQSWNLKKYLFDTLPDPPARDRKHATRSPRDGTTPSIHQEDQQNFGGLSPIYCLANQLQVPRNQED